MANSKLIRTISLAFGFLGLSVALAGLFLKTGTPGPAFPHSDGAAETNWEAVAPGRIEPRSGEIKVAPVIVGRIAEVLVKVNDAVFAGEPMIRIEDEQVRARLAKARTEVNLTKRRRAAPAKGGADRRKLEDAAADAEQTVVEAQAAFDRAAIARRTGTGSNNALDAARTNLSNAQEQLKQRQSELAKHEAGSSTPKPTDLESDLARARIDLRGAQAALDNLTVRAPIGGTVLQVNAKAGEVASPSAPQPLVVLGDVSALRVRAEIDERNFGLISVGQQAVVRSDAFPSREFAGKVSSLAPIVGPARIAVSAPRNPTDVNVAEVIVDIAESGPLATGMKVDVYFVGDVAKR
jgi:HlyD family secretion protein